MIDHCEQQVFQQVTIAQLLAQLVHHCSVLAEPLRRCIVHALLQQVHGMCPARQQQVPNHRRIVQQHPQTVLGSLTDLSRSPVACGLLGWNSIVQKVVGWTGLAQSQIDFQLHSTEPRLSRLLHCTGGGIRPVHQSRHFQHGEPRATIEQTQAGLLRQARQQVRCHSAARWQRFHHKQLQGKMPELYSIQFVSFVQTR